MMAGMDIPTYDKLPLPTLRAIENRGGSATVRELSEDVASSMGLSDEVLSEFENRASWTRTYLKKTGAVQNKSRGVWALTDYGRELLSLPESEAQERLRAEFRTYQSKYRQAAGGTDGAPADTGSDPPSDSEWQSELLATLRAMPPDAFERLCQLVLREHGFTEVEVTQRGADGGIDGKGVLRIGLVSFQVVFQCKRYEGSVGSGQIRDFRGAMVGQAEKGLFLTTGRFSRSAQDEAVRPGAPAIDLIDGLELCQLLKERDLGVRTEMVEQVSVVPAFFEQFERG